jgi:hypothetical protein
MVNLYRILFGLQTTKRKKKKEVVEEEAPEEGAEEAEEDQGLSNVSDGLRKDKITTQLVDMARAIEQKLGTEFSNFMEMNKRNDSNK